MKRYLAVLVLCMTPALLRAQVLIVSPASLSWSKVTPGVKVDQKLTITNNSGTIVTGTLSLVHFPFSILEGTTFGLQPQDSKSFTIECYSLDSGGGDYYDTLIFHSASDTDHR